MSQTIAVISRVALLSVALGAMACGGGFNSVDRLPSSASNRARSQASACDDGDRVACNWLGVWYLVGGAGDAQRAQGVGLMQRACSLGQRDACELAREAAAAFKGTVEPIGAP